MTPDVPDTSAVAAAVVALIAVRVVTPTAREPASLWRDRVAALRAPLMPGPGSWRASALPR